MPRPVDRPLPDAQTLRLALESEGIVAPTGGDEESARGMLFLAAHLVERQKRIRFPDFSWEDPRFVAEDDKVSVGLTFARLAPEESLEGRLLAELPRLGAGVNLLALDAHETEHREFELVHELYGEVTLFAYPHKPKMPKDPRIEAAREAGWGKTLKEHNLLPGRGIVVRDEEQGLFLTQPKLAHLHGILIVLRTSEVHLWWNPFATGLDSELQYWLNWGPGDSASRWKESLYYEGDGAE